MRDFLEFSGNYQSVQIPVRSGSKFGEVQNFLHNSRTLENLKDYVISLQTLIEEQKHYDSEKAGYDVGPTVAVAHLFENSYYRRFVEKLESENNLKLAGCEQVLKVTEGGETYHILPKENLLSLNNTEQTGIIAYSVWRQILKDPNIDVRKVKNSWAGNKEDNYKNRAIFRKSMDDSRIYVIDGPQLYENCLIYKNLCKNIISKFEFDEKEIENVSPLELALVST